MRGVALAAVAVVLVVAGCGEPEATAGGEQAEPGDGEGLTVAASVYPLAWVAQQVAPGAEVEFLGAGSQEAHNLDLTPTQRGAVESADVLVYMGDIGYQPQVEQAASSAVGEVVDVALVAGEDRLLPAGEDAHEEEADEEGEAEEEHAEDGAWDPHVWFDAAIMAEVAEEVGEAFAAADPDNAAVYTENAENVRAELLATADEVDALLQGDCAFSEVIVSHAAYGYLLDPAGYTQHAVVGVTSGEAGASGTELAEIVAEIEAEGFTHVLAEPVEGRADAEAVAREADVELLDVYPLDVVSDEQAEQGYPELLLQQAQSFATALGCS